MSDPANARSEASRTTVHDLRVAWRRLYRAEPPSALTRDLLLRGIAYKEQEQQHGGLGQATKRLLRTLAQSAGSEGGRALVPAPMLKAGARLVRHWRGTTYTVLVLDNGFEHEGGHYRSLSEVAHHITGTNWSGPRFFGLRQARRERGDTQSDAAR